MDELGARAMRGAVMASETVAPTVERGSGTRKKRVASFAAAEVLPIQPLANSLSHTHTLSHDKDARRHALSPKGLSDRAGGQSDQKSASAAAAAAGRSFAQLRQRRQKQRLLQKQL